MALKALTFGDWMWGWLWGSGFDPTPPASLWMPYHYARNWTYTGNHHAHMISNSWGGVVHETSAYNFVSGTEWYSWLIDYLTAYTGTLFIVGSNNAGIGYGTTTYPSSAATLSVGASTSYHIFQNLYDNNSNWVPGGDQIVYYSGNGPTWMGIPKPNVVAVGAGSFVPDAVGYGDGDGTTAFGIFSGTSLATPLTAGVAALVYQVAISEGWLDGWGGLTGPVWPFPNQNNDPYEVKCIIESTAVDLGYDPYRQGAGRVDAFRAVHAAYGNTTDGTDPILIGYSDSAWQNVAAGDRAGFSRGYYMGMRLGEAVYGNGFDYYFLGPDAWSVFPFSYSDYCLTNTHPAQDALGLGGGPLLVDYDNSLYIHSLFPGQWRVETITVEDFGTGLGTGTGTATGWNAYEFTLLNESTTTMTSSSTYTTFPLEDNFDAAFMTQFMAADYVEVFCTYSRDDFEDLFNLASMSNYVFLHDWNDTNNNGQIDLTSSAAAGEVRRISADISYGNNHKMCVGMPGNAFYADPASKGPTIYYHDVGVELFLWRTLDVEVTVRIYQKTAWTGVPIDVDLTSAGGNDWDVNVTVDATAMPGQYGGFIEFFVGGNVATRMPVSVRVDGQVQGGNSMSWGGTTGRPYDNGATYGHIDWGNWGETAGDWRIYWIDVNYQLETMDYNDFTSWVMVNVTWDDPDTVIDTYLYMSGYGNRAYFGPYSATDSGSVNIGDGQWQGEATWPGQNVLLADWTWDAYGGDAYWNYTDGLGWYGGDIWQNETFGYPPDNNNFWRVGDNHTASMSHRGYLGVALHTIHYGGAAAYENFTVTVNTALNSTIPSVRDETLFYPDFNTYDPYWQEWVPNGTYNPLWGAYNWTATAHDGLMSYFPGGAIQVTSHGNVPLTANSMWNGPQVTFQAGWNALTLLPFPSVNIRQTSLELLSGLEQEHYGTITEGFVGGWNPDLNPREGYDFVSLLAGQEVYVECEFGTWTAGEGSPLTHTANDDIDYFIWAPDTPHTYANSLTGATTATGANPEVGGFLAPVSGNYTIGLDWYSGAQPMGWRSYVRAAQATGITEAGQTCTMDTSITATNAAYDVRARMITGTSLDDVTSFATFMITNVSITNFFAPTLSITAPNGGESYQYGVDTVLVQWTASDPNVDSGEEILGFSVEVSNGTLWKTVVFGTTATEATWDPADPYYGFPATSIGPNFLIRVNCTDGMYTVSATSAAVWEVFYLAPLPPPPWELITVVVVVVIVIIILLLTCLLKRRQSAAK
jgi:hypothetical protein